MMNNLVRKEIVIGIMILFVIMNVFIPNIGGNIQRLTIFTVNKISTESLNPIDLYPDYTHTVFVGVATAQCCIPCHLWSENIHDAYISGDYDFEYVDMIVFDHDGRILNQDALNWVISYGISIYPTSIFCGDYQRITGNYPEQLPNVLNDCGGRTVADIDASITLSWLGNATINVDVSIQNNEGTKYNGHIRAFITEITSRYTTKYGDPYLFGFLDYAFNKDISINPTAVYTDSTIWDGNDHVDTHGDDFGDVTAHNIQVTLVVFNDDDGYIDETVTTRITTNNPPQSPNNPSPPDGATDVDVDIDLSWSCRDHDGDPLTYDVYFGNTNPPPLAVANQTANSYQPNTMNYSMKYYWQIIAWDNQGGSSKGYIWEFTTGNEPNDPPYIPNIDGTTSGKAGKIYDYTFVAIDPNGDHIRYYIDWGDDNIEEWIGPYPSGEEIKRSHKWSEQGRYLIRVKAKDIHYVESEWGTLEIDMPVNKQSTTIKCHQFLEILVKKFPILERIFLLIPTYSKILNP